MSLIGYARVSSPSQDLGVQTDQLREAGCDRIFSEKYSGRNAVDREVWNECLEFVREGDVLVFTRLDRVGRSLVDLVNIGAQLRERGVEIRCIQQAVDTTSSEGRLLWGMLAVVAEFEVDLKKDRQKEGIQRAKREGKKIGGGVRRIRREMIEPLKAEGLTARKIAKRLKCDPKTVYRAHPDGWGPAPIGG